MIKYEIGKRTKQFKCKESNEIEQNRTAFDTDTEYLESYDTLEEVLEAFKKYKADIYYYKHTVGEYYYFTEYIIEKNTFDEDGVPVGCVDTLEITEIIFDIIEKDSYIVVASFRNLGEAERFINRYDGEKELDWELR